MSKLMKLVWHGPGVLHMDNGDNYPPSNEVLELSEDQLSVMSEDTRKCLKAPGKVKKLTLGTELDGLTRADLIKMATDDFDLDVNKSISKKDVIVAIMEAMADKTVSE